ncbi:ADP-ribosylglycohydrolase [Pseudactinotalea sp. HY160]|uniref:ADP-ribosylglycohydrolase family protein n=1 Tax=Pseudactinotalea sp. HY160 TaxID=2654490 RepID=UPI00128BCF77|nr:ADP-ribosylglycohydrolase family protein [Pseudactinotalea sp. HY160]MPV51264.1 ADP-ribosylglycohydrolase [Pseudactinotalea sp. HY160]
MSIRDRALGALLGLAIGDALGMPTQSFSRAEIAERFGVITGLCDAPADQPIAPGMPAGSVTDDTEQALLVADLLISGRGRIDARAFAGALRAWEERMIARGSLDLLGPSTKAALAAIAAGTDVAEAGRFGTTNGAAMRITPVGIASPAGLPGSAGLLEAVVSASRVTHNTGLGLSAAAAVAAAVSAGVDGAPAARALELAVAAARAGARLGHWEAGGHVAARFEALRGPARETGDFASFLDEVVGTSVHSQESVVAALLIVERYARRPFEGLCLAAAVGGDTDTIAAIAGAVLGACAGAGAFPTDVRARVEAVNDLGLERRVDALLELRAASR